MKCGIGGNLNCILFIIKKNRWTSCTFLKVLQQSVDPNDFTNNGSKGPIFCFSWGTSYDGLCLAFHDNNDLPRKTQKPAVDFFFSQSNGDNKMHLVTNIHHECLKKPLDPYGYWLVCNLDNLNLQAIVEYNVSIKWQFQNENAQFRCPRSFSSFLNLWAWIESVKTSLIN